MPRKHEDDVHIGLTDAQTAEVTSSVDPTLLAVGFELIREEKDSTFRQALKDHWRAMLWSMFLSVALVMDGYDGAIVSAPLIRLRTWT
jgi:SP family general alpha glucoside:H+ symporter-like MFS transporter